MGCKGGAISDVRIVRIVSFFMGIGCAKAVDNLFITSFSKLDLFWIFLRQKLAK